MLASTVAASAASEQVRPAATSRLAAALAAGAVVVGLVAFFLHRTSNAFIDPDLWHEMALAREIVATGRVPWTDDFAYTPTVTPAVHHEWGAGIVALALANWFGAAGIGLARYGLAAAMIGIAVATAWRRGASFVTLGFCLPPAFLLLDAGFATIRAQLYSMTFFAILLYFFDLEREGRRGWIVPWLAVFVVWINMHAGFLVAAGLFAVHWGAGVVRREPSARLLATGLAMAGLIEVNPFGLAYYSYLWRAATMARPRIVEWAPLWNEPLDLALLLLTLGAALYAVSRIGWRQARGVEMLLVAAIAGSLKTRLVLFYAILWLAYVPGWIDATALGAALREFWSNRKGFVAVVWSVAAVTFLSSALPRRPWLPRVPTEPGGDKGTTYYPVGAVDYLARAGFQGNVMTPFDWGSYVSWKLGPRTKVSLDGRYEVAYPIWLEEESYRFYLAEPGWRETLGKYSTDVVLAPVALPVAASMRAESGWRRVYADGVFDLFARPGLDLPIQTRDRPPSAGAFP